MVDERAKWVSAPSSRTRDRSEKVVRKGYSMSSEQLSHLWEFEFQLANQLLGLPLRTCSAVPSPTWGTEMENNTFLRLKALLRTMWSRAAEMMCICHDDTKGYGLAVSSILEKLCLTENTSLSLGWLVICPKVGDCPTAHRYLRSPIGEDLYLGGPISLMNWAQTSLATVTLRSSSSSLPELKNLYFVKTVRPLSPGTELLWNYGIHRFKEFPFAVEQPPKWINKDCCLPFDDENNTTENASANNLKARVLLRAPSGPLKKKRCIPIHRYCTLCGENVDSEAVTNMKPHLARNHAVDICYGVCCSDDEEVSSNVFLSNLHVFCKTLECLRNHGYNIVPACHFFSVSGIEPLDEKASSDAKVSVFFAFKEESQRAYKNYKTIYLRGVSHPVCYDDILPAKKTNYTHVKWYRDIKPKSGSFSISKALSNNELQTMESTIISSVMNIISEAGK